MLFIINYFALKKKSFLKHYCRGMFEHFYKPAKSSLNCCYCYSPLHSVLGLFTTTRLKVKKHYLQGPDRTWPDGHKWPFWPYLPIYVHLAIEPCATNRAHRCVPVPPVWMKGKKLVSKPWLWRSSLSMSEIKSANNLCSFFLQSVLIRIYPAAIQIISDSFQSVKYRFF